MLWLILGTHALLIGVLEAEIHINPEAENFITWAHKWIDTHFD
jgi:hypothetical protein